MEKGSGFSKSIATKTEIEKGLTIIRWKEKEKEEAAGEEEEEINGELFNIERKRVDLTLKKASDMKFNRRLYAPIAAPEKLESNLQQTREALWRRSLRSTKRTKLTTTAISEKVISQMTRRRG